MNAERMISTKARSIWLGAAASLLTLPAIGATFVVNSTADSVDAKPGDGVCLDSAGLCTLRAAIMESNALAGADGIDLTAISDPANPIVLTIKGVDETYASATGSGTGFVAVAAHDASIGDLNIIDSTTIVGAGSGKTVIQWAAADQAGGSADRIFHIEAVATNVTVAISGVRIANGLTGPVVDIETQADGKVWQFKRHGGGIAIGAAAATNLLDPSITHGGGGGGMGGGGGHGGGEETSAVAIDGVTLTDVNVLSCSSGGDGGGIYNAGPLTVTSSVISGNTAAANGGGIYASATMTITKTTIGTIASIPAFSLPNHAENGGGIFDTGLHTTYITASALVGNTATGGGALAGRSTTIDTIENSTISGNVARDTAGGITTNGRVNLRNVTISGNKVVPTSTTESTVSGVGLSSFGSGQFSYVNTILTNNTLVGATTTLSNCGRTGTGTTGSFLVSAGHNLEDGDSCNLTAAGDLKKTDPQLEPLGDNGGLTQTMAIPMTSPAVDAADSSACPNNDQRGSLRPADGNLDTKFLCDIGAFELFVASADLHVDTMTAPDRAFANDQIAVTMSVHTDPAATGTASGVVIATSPLPAIFTVTSASVTAAGATSDCSVASGVVSCAVASLAPDEVASMAIVGTVTAPGAMSVTGTVSSATPIDPNPANNTATVHVQVTGNADMAVTASGSATPVTALTNTDLAFTVVNNGPNTANSARVAAFLPPELTYLSAVISQGSCAYASTDSSVTCAIGAIASGATVSGTVTVTTALANSSASALFGVAADERDLQPNNDTANVAVQILGVSDLELALRTDLTSLTVGQTVPVYVTLSNLSGLDTTNVVAILTLPSGATFASADSGLSCTASASTVTCTLASLGVGATVTSAVHVKVATAGKLSVSGTVSSDLQDPAPSNNSASTAFTSNNPASSSSGGCAFQPGSPFDPTLPAVLLAGLIGLAGRRLRGRTVRAH
jgi:CSLREA domain-containing protein/uncharacterized repeat protein (TIGR01451 family)